MDSKVIKKLTFFALVITNVDHLMVDHGEFGLVRLWNIGGEQKHSNLINLISLFELDLN